MTPLSPSAIGYNFADLMVGALALAICITLAMSRRERTEGLLYLATATTGLLFAVRVALRVFHEPALRILEGFAVGCLALLALLTAESLARLHAPFLIKAAVAASAVGIFFVTVVHAVTGVGPVSLITGSLFIAALGLTALFVLTRPRKSLFAGESARLSALGVALAIAIPLAATDFLLGRLDGAIGLGAIGVLCILLAIARIVARRSSIRGLTLDIAAALIIGVLLGLLADTIGDPSPEQRRAMFVGFAAISLLVIAAGHLRRQLNHRASLPLAVYLARARRLSHDVFVDDLRPHHLLNGARLLTAAETDDLIDPLLLTEIAGRKVMSRALLDRRAERGAASFAEEAALSLLNSEGAAHLVLMSRSPARVLLAGSSSIGLSEEDVSNLLVLSDISNTIEDGAKE